MAANRNLIDAVSDSTKRPIKARKPTQRRNHVLLKLCLSVICGFVGGYAVGRWIRLI